MGLISNVDKIETVLHEDLNDHMELASVHVLDLSLAVHGHDHNSVKSRAYSTNVPHWKKSRVAPDEVLLTARCQRMQARRSPKVDPPDVERHNV
jgi:hypothetical protein